MKTINQFQKEYYEQLDLERGKEYILRYARVLNQYAGCEDVKILDIGGAVGAASLEVKRYLETLGTQADLFVLDSTKYALWEEEPYKSAIHYIHASVQDMDAVLPEEIKFDLIFAGSVFHHFVEDSWNDTLKGMERCLRMVLPRLKPNGSFCLLDHFCDGIFLDYLPSFLIYSFTSMKNPAVVRVMRKLGAASSGVGVCFQSEKMWKERLEKCGFRIEWVDKSPQMKMSALKKRLLFIVSANKS